MVDGPPLTFDQDLGLLSPFTPPATCLDRITSLDDPRAGPGDGKDRTYFVGMIGNNVDKTCYPPNYTTDVFYPTGSCPSGWVNACSPVYSKGINGTSITLSMFPTGFPAVQCCPSGFTCYDAFFCGSFAPPTSVTALVVSPSTTTMAISITAEDQVWAKPIFVVSATATPGSTASTSADVTISTSGVAASECVISHGGGTSSGLSTEGKIALAAVIPVTVLAIIIAGLWFFLGRRTALGKSESQESWAPPPKADAAVSANSDWTYPPIGTAQYARAEMDATVAPAELSAFRKSMQTFSRR